MTKKRGQVSNILTHLGILILVLTIITALTLLYHFYALKVTEVDIKEEANKLQKNLNSNPYTKDNKLTPEEIEALAAMDCNKLREFFGIQSNLCIYAVDSDGKLVQLNDTRYSFGCEGLVVGGIECGK